jgi:hypothetical protein
LVGGFGDALQHGVQVVENILVAEAQYAVATFLECVGSISVPADLFGIVGMVLSVEFDDEAVGGAAEVEDVATDRVLAAELEIMELPVTEGRPEDGFSGSWFATHVTSEADNHIARATDVAEGVAVAERHGLGGPF